MKPKRLIFEPFSRPWNHGLEIGSGNIPQYSANRSCCKQHHKTCWDRGELSRFFSGTSWTPPCTLPKKTSRDNNKKLLREANPRAPKHVFGVHHEAKIVKNRGPGALQQQSGSEQGPEVKTKPQIYKKNCLGPILSVFWSWFLGSFWNLFFSRFFDQTGPKNGTNTVSLFETLDPAQV